MQFRFSLTECLNQRPYKLYAISPVDLKTIDFLTESDNVLNHKFNFENNQISDLFLFQDLHITVDNILIMIWARTRNFFEHFENVQKVP